MGKVKNQGWVSVKRRLPTVHRDVWVWVIYEDGHERGTESWLDLDGSWSMGSAHNFTVTHWRTLPRKPR